MKEVVYGIVYLSFNKKPICAKNTPLKGYKANRDHARQWKIRIKKIEIETDKIQKG